MVGAGELYQRVLVGVRGKIGSGDTIRSVAEKALFLTFAGKFTHKTLARVYILVVGGRAPGLGTP